MRQSRVRQLRVNVKASRKLALLAESWNLKGEELGRFVRSNGILLETLNLWKEEILMSMKKDLPLYYDKEQDYLKRIEELEDQLREAWMAMGAKPDMRFKKNWKYKEEGAEEKIAPKKKKKS